MYKYLQTARIVPIGLFLCTAITSKGIAQILDNNFDDHDGQLYFYENGKYKMNVFSNAGHVAYSYDTCRFISPPRFTMDLPGKPTICSITYPAIHQVMRFDSLQKAILYQLLANRRTDLPLFDYSPIQDFRNTDTIISVDMTQYLNTIRCRWWEFECLDWDSAQLFGPWINDLKDGKMQWNVHMVVFAEMYFAFFNFERYEVERMVESIKLYRCPYCFESGVRTTLPFAHESPVVIYLDSSLTNAADTVCNGNRHVAFRLQEKTATSYRVAATWFENDNKISEGWIGRNTPLIIAPYPPQNTSYLLLEYPRDNCPEKEVWTKDGNADFHVKDFLLGGDGYWIFGYCLDENGTQQWGWIHFF